MKKLIISLLALMLLFAAAGLADLGDTPVNVTLISPATGNWNNTGLAHFQFNVSGNMSATNYTCNLYHDISQTFGIDSLQVNATVDNATTTIFIETGIPENSTGWNWNVECYSSGNTSYLSRGKTNWTYKIDTTDPVLSASVPADGTWDTDGLVNLTVNITEANPNNCVLNTNLNTTADGNTTGDFNYTLATSAYLNHVFVGFDFGTNTSDPSVWIDNNGGILWNVSCDDDAGNVLQTSAITFYVDSVSPTQPNVTAPTNSSTTTDYTPLIQWLNVSTTTELNFSHYEVLVDNDSDFSSPAYEENVTTITQNYTTASTGLSGDLTYYFRVRTYDLAGNYGSDQNGYLYSTDSTCHTLYAGWNICSVIRSTNVNATDLCDEVGSTCTYVAKYNSSHNFQTYTSGAATNAGLNFNSTTTPNEDAVYFIYVSAETVFENRTWSLSANSFNFTLTNYSTGWNLIPVLNQSGVNFTQLDYSINGDGTAVNDTNSSHWMSFYNESAASGSKYIPFVRNWSINMDTFIDYGDALWIHYNTTGPSLAWDGSGEI